MEVREVLVQSFDKLDKLQFEKLRELTPLDHPNGTILDYEMLAEHQENQDIVDNEHSFYPSQHDEVLQELVPVQTNEPSQEIKSNNPSFPGVQDKPFQLVLPIDTVENNSTGNTLHKRKEEKKTVILPTTRVTRSAKQKPTVIQ